LCDRLQRNGSINAALPFQFVAGHLNGIHHADPLWLDLSIEDTSSEIWVVGISQIEQYGPAIKTSQFARAEHELMHKKGGWESGCQQNTPGFGIVPHTFFIFAKESIE
jgi:hypothetical protein